MDVSMKLLDDPVGLLKFLKSKNKNIRMCLAMKIPLHKKRVHKYTTDKERDASNALKALLFYYRKEYDKVPEDHEKIDASIKIIDDTDINYDINYDINLNKIENVKIENKKMPKQYIIIINANDDNSQMIFNNLMNIIDVKKEPINEMSNTISG